MLLRALCRWFRSRSRQGRSVPAARLGIQQRFRIGVLINDACAILKESAGVGRWSVGAVQLMPENSEICRQLAAMVSRMRNAAHQDPGSSSGDIKKLDILLEPRVLHR